MSEPIRMSADDVRQGVTGHNVRYVLFWGIVLAIGCAGCGPLFCKIGIPAKPHQAAQTHRS